MKAAFAAAGEEPPCTAFEAVTAVEWRCRTRAAMVSESDPDAPALLVFSANARKHVGAMEGYYGNCVTTQLVTEKSGAVANGDIVELVKKIREAKERIPDQLRKKKDEEGEGGMNRAQQAAMDAGEQTVVLRDRYDMVMMSSWQNLGFDEVDFGSGKPARVTSRVRERSYFLGFGVLQSCKGRDGVSVQSVFVKKKHADGFLEELARLV